MIVEELVKHLQGLTPESKVMIRTAVPFIDMAPLGELFIEECGDDNCLYYIGLQQVGSLGKDALLIEVGKKPWTKPSESIEMLKLAVTIIDDLYSQQAMPDDHHLPNLHKIMTFIHDHGEKQ